MLIGAYDWEAGILTHAVSAEQTVNVDYYCRFLRHHLRPAMKRKRLRLLQNHLPIALHDLVHCHITNNVILLQRRWPWKMLEHPPYSPDISPCDFDLLPKLKEQISPVTCSVVDTINTLPMVSHRLPNIWQTVISFNGDYKEGMYFNCTYNFIKN
ncbi:mariner Mos1 transposase [Trichonephila clavipes]|nr:mariner Mos1 transposase [Trichonephila clavipes]